jgi:hypothetical protein
VGTGNVGQFGLLDGSNPGREVELSLKLNGAFYDASPRQPLLCGLTLVHSKFIADCGVLILERREHVCVSKQD